MSLARQALGGECPHCEAEQPGARRARPPIGPPFAECASCGQFISRPLFNEWALLSNVDRFNHLALAVVRTLVFGIVPALLVAGFSLSGGEPVEPRAALVAAGLGLLAVGVWVGARWTGEIARSRRRMTDPMYLARLAEFAKAGTGRVADETRAP